MPARAVVFNSFRKHDGREFRELLAGEYIQMAGRAGRRGLDKFGTVIITCWNDLPAEVTMRKLLTGRPTLLSSQFRLRYNMILNLVRVNNLSVQEMIKRSYTEFATQRQLSQSEIGSKLRKYEMLLSFYEQEILWTEFEKKGRQLNDDSVLDDSEKEKRENYLELVKEFQNSFQTIQGLFFEQLKYLKYQFNSQVSMNKRFDFVGFFSFGRIVQLQNSSSGSPCWGFVLMDPIASKKAATAATVAHNNSKSAGVTKKVPLSLNANSKLTVGKQQNTATSAFAASRAALLGQGTAANSGSSAETNNSRGGERGAWGSEGPQDNLEEMFVWTLCLVNEKDLPEWCSCSSSSVENKKIKRMEAEEDKLVLSSLQEEFFCPNHPLSPFMIIKVFLKDIGNTLSPRLSLPSLPSSTTKEEKEKETEQSVSVSLTELLSEFVLAISPTSSSSSSTSSGVVYTDFLKEHKINDINFHERQMKLMNCITQELIPATTLVHSFFEEGNPNPDRSSRSADQSSDSFFQLSRLYPKLLKLQKIQRKIELIKHFISDENLSLFPDFQQRINFLRSLGYLDREENVITKKGRVCCELNTCDELLGTEMLFHNILEPLNPPEAVAILSALIFQEKNDVEEVLTTRMETARSEIINLLYQINTLQKLEGIEEFSLEDQKNNQNRKRGGGGGGSGSGSNSNNQFISSTSNKPIINFGLCSVVYQWARGIPFKEITRMTEFQEGSIVRTITRLDELCRDIQNAARVMGNPSLYYKMEAASQCIKRDIVFAASLYLVD
jgi:hypothetical protein